MPKGDRNILKADTEDGFTKIADLLLEALAMAKLNGVQKGICLFLWRRTYGWEQKEDYITLKEFANACDSIETYVSKQLKQLIAWNVIQRTSYEPGKTPAYTFNTRVAQWDKGCLNRQGLSDNTRKGLYKRRRVGLSDQTRVDQGTSLEPQGIEGSLYTDLINNNNHDDDNSNTRERENFETTFQQEFGQPISPNIVELLDSYIKDGMKEEVICEAIKRARTQGILKVSYVKSILNGWKSKQVTNMAGVAGVDLEFEQMKKRGQPKGGKPRGPTQKHSTDWDENKFYNTPIET